MYKHYIKMLVFGLVGFAVSVNADIYLKKTPVKMQNKSDEFLRQLWEKNKISIPCEASDNVMVRRLYIDLAGRVPTPQEAKKYVESKDAEKQSVLVAAILASEEHAMFWTMRFGDEMRIKSEFPINLWPNAAFLYSRVIYDFLNSNMPYDIFAEKLLTAQGSNFRNGYANFFRAVPQKNANEIANAVAMFFLGCELKKLENAEQKKLLEVFDAVRFKSTREWKEEIVYSLQSTDNDSRKVFVQSLLKDERFAYTMVRRCWRWLFGNGEVSDDIIKHYAEYFRKNNYDVRKLVNHICTSAAYRAGCFSDNNYAEAVKYGAVYPVRRIDAEVLADSIAQITNRPYSYSSVIPEPFSFFNNRAAALTDGSVTDSFLMLFGRPSRDFGTVDERKSEITPDQRLYLFNSSDLHNRLQRMWGSVLKKEKDKLSALYWLFYSRPISKQERDAFRAMQKKHKNNWKVQNCMPWVLLNSKEFLYQH